MPSQEIITYTIVAFTIVFVLFSLYKTLFPAKLNDQQGGCSSGCSCDAVKMRKELLKNTKKLSEKSAV